MSLVNVILTVALTAVVATFAGAAAGARAARRYVRRAASQAFRQEERSGPPPGLGIRTPEAAPASWPARPAGPAMAGQGAAAPPLAPTRRPGRVPDGRPSPAGQPGRVKAGLPALADFARSPVRPTPVMSVPAPDLERAVLRVSTAVGDRTYPLSSEEGLTVDPRSGDIVVPELAAGLILGRNGDVWTVQTAGPVDPAVALDGVPLTSVAMPWTSSRRLTAGALTLTLENAPSGPAFLDEPAICVRADAATTWSARANAYGLAIGTSVGRDAATLVTAALAGFDPRMLDPARAAALAALNVTLAVRGIRREHLDGVAEESPEVAVLGIDEKGELRGAANFDVSVWALTQRSYVPLSRPVAQETSPLEVVPLNLHVSADLGSRPALLLTAGAPPQVIEKYLHDATTRTVSPDYLVRAVAGGSHATCTAAAAAVVSRGRHSGTPALGSLR